MKRATLTTLACAALLGSALADVPTESDRNPYQGIMTRNAFDLKPIPIARPTPTNPPAPALDIFLTGISTLGGVKKVLLQVEDKSPGKKVEYLPPLVEKDVQGRIEIVSIQAELGEVVLRVDGQDKTLTFEKNAPKPGPATPPAPGPNPMMRPALPGPPLPPTATATAATAPAPSATRPGVVVGGGPAPAAEGGALPTPPSVVRSAVPYRGTPLVR
jgi:hypothetical protein